MHRAWHTSWQPVRSSFPVASEPGRTSPSRGIGPSEAGLTVQAVGISKRFGQVQALDQVSVQLRPGRVHAVVGENGAGKSTLSKIFAGLLRPDAGWLGVGETVLSGGHTRAQAVGTGIGYVPQQLSLVPTLTVLENYLLSAKGRSLFLKRREARDSLVARSAEFGMPVPIEDKVEHLSLSQRQVAEVLISLGLGARLLLLDEPTSSLGPVEVERLIVQLRILAERGVGVMLVTHRLNEVFKAADEVTVLRAGRVVHMGEIGDIDPGTLAHRMIGRQDVTVGRPNPPTERIRLAVEGLAVSPGSGPAVQLEELRVAEGEIVAVAGVGGNGQGYLAEALSGIRAPTQGRVLVDGVDITGDPARATELGVAYLPEERRDGLIDSMSLMDNVAVVHDVKSRRFGMRALGPLMTLADDICREFDVRPRRPWLKARALSGGNQQKLMVGREMRRNVTVLIAHGPSQGLDLGASQAVRSAIRVLAERHGSVILISSELDEILALAHRVLVIYGGRIVDQFGIEEFDEGRIGRAMAGIS